MRGRAVNQFTGYLREWLTVSWLSLRIHEITSRFEGKTTPFSTEKKKSDLDGGLPVTFRPRKKIGGGFIFK